MDRNQALLDVLVGQRNDASNAAANAVADLAMASARIVALEARIKELEVKE